MCGCVTRSFSSRFTTREGPTASVVHLAQGEVSNVAGVTIWWLSGQFFNVASLIVNEDPTPVLYSVYHIVNADARDIQGDSLVSAFLF
jgi:hypothetical protein